MGSVALTIALAGLCGCNEEFAPDPPRAPESVIAESPSSADAGSVARESSHAMTVTLCSSSPEPCPAIDGDAAHYRVAFGSGRGATRSRGQAVADLYQELRDRTALGSRLEVEAHAIGDGGGGSSQSSAEPTTSSDPLSSAAARLVDVVDEAGEVTIDVVHGSESSRCLVSVRGEQASGRAPRCLVQAPEQHHSQQPRAGGRRGY
jgi:hypothetical protein